MSTIWCLVIDHNKQLIGKPFPLSLTPNINIAQLSKDVEKQASLTVPAHQLIVWQCKEPKLLANLRVRQLQQLIADMDLSNESVAIDLASAMEVTSLDLSEKEILLVQLPAPTTLNARNDNPPQWSLNKYSRAFIYLQSPVHPTHADINDNRIYNRDLTDLSSFRYVTQIDTELSKKRKIGNNAKETLQEMTLSADGLYEYIVNNGLPGNVSIEVPWMLHELSREFDLTDGNENLEHFLSWRIFYPLKEYIDSIASANTGGKIECLFGTNAWHWSIIVFIQNLHRAVTNDPKSDFSWWINGYPRLLAEARSKGNKDDLTRLQLQAGSCVRLANLQLREEGKENEFVLPVVYVDNNLIASRYLFFQSKEDLTDGSLQVTSGADLEPVFYTSKIYNLRQKSQRFYFMCELLNLADLLLQNNVFEAPKRPPTDYANLAKQQINTTFNGLLKTSVTTKRRRQNENVGEKDPSSRGGNVAPVDSLTVAGTQLQTSYQLAENVYRACQIGDQSGRTFVIKRVRPDSDEEEILQQLSTTAGHLCEHIIEFIGVVDTGPETGRWIVLPERQPVVFQLFKGGPLHGRFVQLSRDLAKGVTFLHNNNIAHLDIKPANLVYTSNFCLQIIDFDTSMRVRDENEEISGRVGSEGYMAPEMGPEEGIYGQRLYYSPIRADRYSCGVVMKEFARLHEEDDEGLMDFANKLMSTSPYARPRLSEWCKSAVDDLVRLESETLVGEGVYGDKLAGIERSQKRRRVVSNSHAFNGTPLYVISH